MNNIINNKEKEILISYIVPVYNTYEYLSECVESIVKTRSNDYNSEIILVDDGSTDGSSILCDLLKQKYRNIVVEHQPNAGVSAARNRGLAIAQGKWICFVDSDDMLTTSFEDTVMNSLDDKYDIVYFSFGNHKKRERKLDCLIKFYEANDDDIQLLQRKCLCRYYDSKSLVNYRKVTSPCCKLYKRSFIEKYAIRFEETLTFAEDVVFNLECLAWVKYVCICSWNLYLYRKNLNSATHYYRKEMKAEIFSIYDMAANRIDKFYKSRDDMQEVLYVYFLWYLLYCVVLDCAHKNNPQKYRDRKNDFLQLLEKAKANELFKQVKYWHFPLKQAMLAFLVKYKCFFVINCLCKISIR